MGFSQYRYYTDPMRGVPGNDTDPRQSTHTTLILDKSTKQQHFIAKEAGNNINYR